MHRPLVRTGKSYLLFVRKNMRIMDSQGDGWKRGIDVHSLIQDLTESDKIPFEGVGVGAHRFGQGQGGDVLGFLKDSLIELLFVKK